MKISRKIVLTGVVTLGVFALGTAGAAVAHTLTIEDHAGAVQNIAPVTTGTKAESSTSTLTWDKTKAMTRKEWDSAKKKWAMEKVKWQDCNRKSSAEKLAAPKSWSFIGSCMTKS